MRQLNIDKIEQKSSLNDSTQPKIRLRSESKKWLCPERNVFVYCLEETLRNTNYKNLRLAVIASYFGQNKFLQSKMNTFAEYTFPPFKTEPKK